MLLPFTRLSARRRRLATAVLGCLAAATLTACSSSSSSTDDLLSSIRESKQLSIAVSSFAPQDFQDATGTWTGYDIDILTGFAQSLGASLVIHPQPFSASIQSVSSGRDHLTVDVYYTAERAKVITYSRPMLNYNDVVAVRKSQPGVSDASVGGLTGKSIGVTTGSTSVTEAQKTPGAKAVNYTEFSDALLALDQGRIDAVYASNTNIPWLQKQNQAANVAVVGPVPSSIAPPIETLRGYFGLPQGAKSANLLNKLNAYLKQIACDGTEQKILDKYGLTAPYFLDGICNAPDNYTGS
ncbi:substrate-binding periplasmic protein [Amycolatopsis pithecellobii]|uniref:Transporter substrate-binding domain-containing protein n=1 Tax=Amycolatopsis pithecellobii TaxID=664692 RepID=A0A6N7Z0N2_9PSEU|nr:transporter substrate-binding domain-containing protein [Amycolatopsis pithecellobii]MTD54269.1 transporter substrate-binding domain-containing protein [Amycolatopsis pithecellobii]